VEKYVIGRQHAHDYITQSMGFACWVTKATNTHSEYALLLALHCNKGFANGPLY